MRGLGIKLWKLLFFGKMIDSGETWKRKLTRALFETHIARELLRDIRKKEGEGSTMRNFKS